MKQTQTYKFDLVERGDVFSPDPLNQNMEKVEAQFDAARAEAAAGDAAEAAARTAADAALDQRVVQLEARRMVIGTYTGNGNSDGQTIHLGFTPAIVLMPNNSNSDLVIAAEHVMDGSFKIVEGGFFVMQTIHDNPNQKGKTYTFLALL